LLENAHYRAVAAGLLALRARHPLPAGAPVTVLAAPDAPHQRDRQPAPDAPDAPESPHLRHRTDRWTLRQRGLARTLGGRFVLVPDAGHLLMLDRPDAVAAAVLDVRAR
ncbi:alpha/beta fold hydrolase, partial [Streptomyces sp. TRM64462]|uniref:alpha/beta fold hydrolase n=1 Tax=Streptomyces sp. TRM64462 TaxID=2741726 RepID=UPI0035CD1C45